MERTLKEQSSFSRNLDFQEYRFIGRVVLIGGKPDRVVECIKIILDIKIAQRWQMEEGRIAQSSRREVKENV